MELRELRPAMLVWFPITDDDSILCRVRYIGRDYVSLQVLAATAEQVLRGGHGVGEQINSLPHVLKPAKAS